MPLTGSRRTDALASRPVRRRPWRFRLAVIVSLVIHVVIGVMLLVTIRREEKAEMLPPPAPVTMVFETGRRTGPTLPNPDLQATPAQPPSSVAPEQTPLPTPPLPPAPRPPPPPSVAPPPVAPPAPAPAEPVPPRTAEPTPLPPPPKPAPRPSPPKPRPPSDFPAPTDFSFGSPPAATKAPPRSASTRHFPGTIDMSLGPASRGTADPTPYSDRDDSPAGADWRNALSRWVSEHAFYPDRARNLGEEGDVRVHVIAAPDGRVKEVELVGKSGSMWLDIGLVSMFRDAHIPPFPGSSEPIDFNFTMHYILIRPR